MNKVIENDPQKTQYKIAVISKSDASQGGAGRVAAVLAQLLNQEKGFVCHHWMAYPGENSNNHVRRLFGGRFERIQRASRTVSRVLGYPDFFTPELFRLYRVKDLDYDLYHFHDISFACSPIGMRWLSARRPIVWTFHDCSPFTGGCIYPGECKAWLSECKNCRQLARWPLMARRDCTKYMQAYKLRMAKDQVYTPIVPSSWMGKEALKTGVFASPPRVIPYGVETDLFFPKPRAEARQMVGLPPDRFTLLVSAHTLGDPRKGTRHVVEAIRALDRPVSLVAIGNADQDTIDLLRSVDAYMTGFISDISLLASYYSSADVFCCPSSSDNLPMVVLETLSCGVPCVAFRSGGISDMVEHDVNGWLSEVNDFNSFLNGLRIAMKNPERLQSWGAEARAKTERLFSTKVFVEAHKDLYLEMLSGKENRRHRGGVRP